MAVARCQVRTVTTLDVRPLVRQRVTQLGPVLGLAKRAGHDDERTAPTERQGALDLVIDQERDALATPAGDLTEEPDQPLGGRPRPASQPADREQADRPAQDQEDEQDGIHPQGHRREDDRPPSRSARPRRPRALGQRPRSADQGTLRPLRLPPVRLQSRGCSRGVLDRCRPTPGDLERRSEEVEAGWHLDEAGQGGDRWDQETPDRRQLEDAEAPDRLTTQPGRAHAHRQGHEAAQGPLG